MYNEETSPPPEISGGGEVERRERRVWVPECRRTFKATGRVVIQPAHWMRLPGPLPEDAWVQGAPLRSVGHLLAAFRADVREHLGADVPSRELTRYWWSAVEEAEW